MLKSKDAVLWRFSCGGHGLSQVIGGDEERMCPSRIQGFNGAYGNKNIA